MDRRLLLAAVLLLAGIVHFLLPVYFTMTGFVLCALGAGFLAVWLLEKREKRGLSAALQSAMACGVIVLMILMGQIAGYGAASDWTSADSAAYAVVLGCQVQNDNQPSSALCSRILLAAELLERNPDVTVIVSGGMGSDEHITEAQCMYDTLTAINPDWSSRVIMEEQASTTRENLLFSMEIIEQLGGTDRPVTIVTSEYHMARAVYIAGTLDMDVAGICSTTAQPVFRLNYYLREVFAFVKAFAAAA